MNVQIWLAKDPSTDQADTYEPVTCPGCQRLHFINKTTGKLLGEKEKQAALLAACVVRGPRSGQAKASPYRFRFRALAGPHRTNP